MPQITYEITASVESSLIDEYELFMTQTHIPDLMATGNFVSATFSRSDTGRYRIRYEAKDRDHLDRYLRTDAPRLRSHVAEVFPTGVDFSREEWDVLGSFTEGESDDRP